MFFYLCICMGNLYMIRQAVICWKLRCVCFLSGLWLALMLTDTFLHIMPLSCLWQNVVSDLSYTVRCPVLDKWEGIKQLKAALWALVSCCFCVCGTGKPYFAVTKCKQYLKIILYHHNQYITNYSMESPHKIWETKHVCETCEVSVFALFI